MTDIQIDLGKYYAVWGEDALDSVTVPEGSTGSLLTTSGERLLLASENGTLRPLATEVITEVIQVFQPEVVESRRVQVGVVDNKPVFEFRDVVITPEMPEITKEKVVPCERLIPAASTSGNGYLIPKYIDPTCQENGIPLDASGKCAGFTPTDTTNIDRFGPTAEGYIHQPQPNDGWPVGFPVYLKAKNV